MKQEPGTRRGRVAHITTVHRPFDPRIFHKQLRSLWDAGFDTHLIAPHDRSEQRDGIALHPLPTGRRAWHTRVGLHPIAYRKARTLDADLYQIHDPELLPAAVLLKNATGARIVYDMHEDYRTKGPAWGRLLRALERWSFRHVDHVLLAETSYRSIMEGADVDHTCVLNYFAPYKEQAPGKGPGKGENRGTAAPRRLLYTGTVANKRGLRTMIDLAAAVRQRARPERLDIVGVCNRARQREAAEARIREAALEKVVTRVGWDAYVPPSAMDPYYRRADVGLFLAEPYPNFVTSLPTKFYEYLHYGLPIICTDVPLWRSFVEENDCGTVVPSGDPDAVLDVLDQWRNQPDRYRTYVQNAQAAAPKYRWEPMGKRLVGVYRTLLSS